MRAGTARLIACSALLIISGVLLAACNLDDDPAGNFTPAEDNVLTVVTQPFPTAGFWEGTAAHPTGGFEYAMAEELADRLGLDGINIKTSSFSNIVKGEMDGADVALSLITPTSEREAKLDFTTPYLYSTPALLVRSGTEVPDLKTAQQMLFAVGRDTTLEDFVDQEIRPDLEPLRFENRERQIEAVTSGRADVAVFDLAAAQAIVNEDDRLAIAAQLNDPEPIAAALPKGSGNSEAIGSALRAMETDGTIDRLSAEWLGTSLSDVADNTPLLRTGP